jgi:hypothetical protein
MDDFLYNLRNSNQRNYDQNRRQYDQNRFNKQQDRQPGMQKKRPYGNHRALQTDQFNILRGLIEQMVMHQENHLDQAERAAAALERQAAAMEIIAAGLARMSGVEGSVYDSEKSADVQPTPAVVADEAGEEEAVEEVSAETDSDQEKAPTQRLPRSQLLGMIRQMRENELSYEKIADAFNDRGIATLSGKGIWRGQSIYRLFHHG